MKPHEEDWSYTVLSAYEWDQEPTEERMRLAAQAPAMARGLLYAAGFRMDGAFQMNACKHCGEKPHRPGCLFLILLRDAGVIP